jgi:hypothetical protein
LGFPTSVPLGYAPNTNSLTRSTIRHAVGTVMIAFLRSEGKQSKQQFARPPWTLESAGWFRDTRENLARNERSRSRGYFHPPDAALDMTVLLR